MIGTSALSAARVPSRVSRIAITATALLGLLATPDVCRAMFIIAPLPAGTPILQLPELPTSRGFHVIEPTTGTSIFIETGNLVRVNSATDRIERTIGSADWEGFQFIPDNPNVFTGIAFDASYSAIPFSQAQVFILDQFSRTRIIDFPRSNQRVSIVGTEGETIRFLTFGAREIGSFVGPFQLLTVPVPVPVPVPEPEPSSLMSCLTAALAFLGYRWRRRPVAGGRGRMLDVVASLPVGCPRHIP